MGLGSLAYALRTLHGLPQLLREAPPGRSPRAPRVTLRIPYAPFSKQTMSPSFTSRLTHCLAVLLTAAAIPLAGNAHAFEKSPRCAGTEPSGPAGTAWSHPRESDHAGEGYYGPDTLPAKRLGVKPSPGPGYRVQLTLQDPPDVPVLVTIQDRLGFTHYQRWHQPGALLTVHFEDTTRSLPPGVYSASVSAGRLFFREKFIVE